MKRIQATNNEHQWPRQAVASVETRKRDLVVRISDWHRITSGTGGYDVEMYIGGVYDWNESANFDTKAEAVAFAQAQIAKLSMTTKAETERTEAIEQLRKWLKPGDTVYTILRHVSRSGMQRKISVVVLTKDDAGRIIDLHPNWSVAKATGYQLDADGHDSLVVNGAGMDMGFDVVYNLSRAVFPEYQCLGWNGNCPSNEHVNNRGKESDVYGTAVVHTDGYALSHRWL